ncbi:hypothetical protein GIB67_025449 [Kingdonia uniflora]|uniref:DUF547 domain-containing protein n=1 Tax=Kingdonia uniflora TaxID=39325 RepID=A0A7J7N1I4_9MAGN|nr:hypothetical protein GIB67_025449 [Kingdonia uniflora]
MMLKVNCQTTYSSSSSLYMNSPSVPENGLHRDDILDISPQLSYDDSCIGQLERKNRDQSPSHLVGEKALGCSSTTNSPSTPLSKSAEELIDEIATLEVEIVHLERHLLSLYREALKSHQTNLPYGATDQSSKSHLDCNGASPLEDIRPHSFSCEDTETQTSGVIQYNLTSPVQDPKETSKKDPKKGGSQFRSLADHLGTSLLDHVPETPDMLSENIIRCIASIYCRLANPPLPSDGLTASPTSSLSSTNTFSPPDFHDNWSPQCSEESSVNPFQSEGVNVKNGPYAEMIEVPKIWLDDDRFNYAATMLQNFRSLVQRLEKVDPLKMKREEKLAFWINIHNALLMHAYLAYGIRNNRMKSSSLVLKAAYNIGGHSINAYIIQSSILGCHQHRSGSWLQTLFSPAGTKFQTGSDKHPYALDYPEPLVHFALSSGAHSDPAVRVYTAKSVFQVLKLAKHEFIEASVCIYKGTKVILPKILYYFAKDISLNFEGLLEIVQSCMSESHQKDLEKCLKGKPDKCIEWSSYNSTFRYSLHRDLAKAKVSV